jgi:RNAse (barnase) inhibitor barstar
MAPFRWPHDAGRLDFELLRHTSTTLYFSRDVLGEHVEWLRQHQYVVHSFPCAGWKSEDDFHAEASRVLGFPDYYGRNLDAFNDCLCQIEIPEDGGTVLVFDSFEAVVRLSPQLAWHILDIIAKWSRFFLLTDRRLLTLVHSGDENLRHQLKPVGACPVLLNRTEVTRETRRRLEQAGVVLRPDKGARDDEGR